MHNLLVNHYHNYNYINNTTLDNTIQNLLENCDYFIYQPLSHVYPIYNTDNLIKYLKQTCIKISFPYIYCDAFTPLFNCIKYDFPINGEYSTISPASIIFMNKEVVINLKERGKTIEEIINMYDNNLIDFNYESRFKNTISILEEKEKNTDIKVSNFIKNNYKKYKLFNYDTNSDGSANCNHPSNVLILEYVNQILNIMGFDSITYNGTEFIGSHMLVSRYDIKYYNYEWVTSESPHIDNIIKIY